jgi:hypothetical protein
VFDPEKKYHGQFELEKEGLVVGTTQLLSGEFAGEELQLDQSAKAAGHALGSTHHNLHQVGIRLIASQSSVLQAVAKLEIDVSSAREASTAPVKELASLFSLFRLYDQFPFLPLKSNVFVYVCLGCVLALYKAGGKNTLQAVRPTQSEEMVVVPYPLL